MRYFTCPVMLNEVKHFTGLKISLFGITWHSQIMYYVVYILENDKDKTWYIGFTSNLKERLKDHLRKASPYTAQKTGKWKLIYAELYLNKKDALGREKFLKSGGGHKYLKKQLKNYLN